MGHLQDVVGGDEDGDGVHLLEFEPVLPPHSVILDYRQAVDKITFRLRRYKQTLFQLSTGEKYIFVLYMNCTYELGHFTYNCVLMLGLLLHYIWMVNNTKYSNIN